MCLKKAAVPQKNKTNLLSDAGVRHDFGAKVS